MAKTPWIRPQLIVLGRGCPEENVLTACKVPSEGGPGQFPCSHHTVPECRIDSKS